MEFVNARAKLLHCNVDNIAVDITVNQPGALVGSLFLDDIDRAVGLNHLFKRALLLVKVRTVCCYNCYLL